MVSWICNNSSTGITKRLCLVPLAEWSLNDVSLTLTWVPSCYGDAAYTFLFEGHTGFAVLCQFFNDFVNWNSFSWGYRLSQIASILKSLKFIFYIERTRLTKGQNRPCLKNLWNLAMLCVYVFRDWKCFFLKSGVLLRHLWRHKDNLPHATFLMGYDVKNDFVWFSSVCSVLSLFYKVY